MKISLLLYTSVHKSYTKTTHTHTHTHTEKKRITRWFQNLSDNIRTYKDGEDIYDKIWEFDITVVDLRGCKRGITLGYTTGYSHPCAIAQPRLDYTIYNCSSFRMREISRHTHRVHTTLGSVILAKKIISTMDALLGCSLSSVLFLLCDSHCTIKKKKKWVSMPRSKWHQILGNTIWRTCLK